MDETHPSRPDKAADSGDSDEPPQLEPLTHGNCKRLPKTELQIVGAIALAPAELVERARSRDEEAPGYGHLQGLNANVTLADPGDALLLLEKNLPSLPLNHYLKLYDPALALRDVLSAISRAKDELVGPTEYRAFGEAMLARSPVALEELGFFEYHGRHRWRNLGGPLISRFLHIETEGL